MLQEKNTASILFIRTETPHWSSFATRITVEAFVTPYPPPCLRYYHKDMSVPLAQDFPLLTRAETPSLSGRVGEGSYQAG